MPIHDDVRTPLELEWEHRQRLRFYRPIYFWRYLKFWFKHHETIQANNMTQPPADRPERRFPIIGGPSLPWWVIAPHEAQAQKNHGQSLERLAQRGGLSPGEALAVLESKGLSAVVATSDEAALPRLTEYVYRTERLMVPPPADAEREALCERASETLRLGIAANQTDADQAWELIRDLAAHIRRVEVTELCFCGKAAVQVNYVAPGRPIFNCAEHGFRFTASPPAAQPRKRLLPASAKEPELAHRGVFQHLEKDAAQPRSEDARALLRRVSAYFAATRMGEPDSYHNPVNIKELRSDIDAFIAAGEGGKT